MTITTSHSKPDTKRDRPERGILEGPGMISAEMHTCIYSVPWSIQDIINTKYKHKAAEYATTADWLAMKYHQTSIYKSHLSRQYNWWSLRCIWSIACRRCSNYIFILDLRPYFNGVGRDYKTRRKTFRFCVLFRFVLEVWRYVYQLYSVQYYVVVIYVAYNKCTLI